MGGVSTEGGIRNQNWVLVNGRGGGVEREGGGSLFKKDLPNLMNPTIPLLNSL